MASSAHHADPSGSTTTPAKLELSVPHHQHPQPHARCSSCDADVSPDARASIPPLCPACSPLQPNAGASVEAAPAVLSEEDVNRTSDSAMIFENWQRLQSLTRRRVGPAMAFFEELRGANDGGTSAPNERQNFSCYRCLLCVRVNPTPEKVEEIRLQVLSGRKQRRPFGFVVKHFSSTKGGTSALYNHANRTHCATLEVVRRLVEGAAPPVASGNSGPSSAVIAEGAPAAVANSVNGMSYLKRCPGHSEAPVLGSVPGDAKRRKVRGMGVRHAQTRAAEQELAAALCKSLTPLSVLDDPWFRRWAQRREKDSIIPPTRACMINEVLPKLATFVRSEVVQCAATAVAVSLSWDLWMQRGEQRVYSLLAHFLDEKWESQCCSLGNVTVLCEGDDMVENAARNVRELLETHSVLDKVVAVEAGCPEGENLLCQIAARVGGIGSANGDGVQHAVASHGVPFFEVPCLAESISSTVNRAYKNEAAFAYESELGAVGAPNVSFEEVAEAVSSLIACINRTKESEYRKVRSSSLPCDKEDSEEDKTLLTPWVNSKFISMFRSWKRIVQKRHLLFSSESSGHQTQGLQPDQLLYVCAVVKALRNVHRICANASGRWLLPDAVHRLMRLVTENCDQLLAISQTTDQLSMEDDGEPMLSTAMFEDAKEQSEKIAALEGWFVSRMMQGLEVVIEPLISYCPERAYYFLAVATDPRYSSMAELLQMTKRLMQVQLFQFRDRPPGGIDETVVKRHVKGLLDEYDRGVLIPMMMCSMDALASKRQQNVGEGSAALLRDGQMGDGGVFENEFQGGLFPRQVEEDPEEVRRKLMENELERFRHQEKSYGKENNGNVGVAWWKVNGYLYPNLSRVFRQIVSIPSSFVDLERVFTPQGILVALRREGLSVDCRDDVACVHENLTEEIFARYQGRTRGNDMTANRELNEEQMIAEIAVVLPELLMGAC